MASKGIDIAIGATYDNSGVVEANKSLAALYADVRDRSESARQAVLKEAEAYSSVAAQADKMAKAVGGSYVDLEQEASALEQKIRDAFDAAHAAAIEAKYGTESFEKVLQRANKAVLESNRLNSQAAQIADVLKKKREELAQMTDKESAAYLKLSHEIKVLEKAQEEFGGAVNNSGDEAKAFGISLNDALSAARGNTNALIKVVVKLKDSFGALKNVSVGAIGAAGAAIAGIISLVGALKDLIVTAFNLDQPSADVKKINAAFNDLNNKAETFNTSMDDARKASERMTKAFEEQANALAKVAKAQNELKRTQEILAVKKSEDARDDQYERDKIRIKYDSENAKADEEAAQAIRDRRRQSINEERNRVRAEIDNAKKMMREYQNIIKSGHVDGASEKALDARDLVWSKEKHLEDLNRRIDILDNEDEAASAASQKRILEENETLRKLNLDKRLRDDEKRASDFKAFTESGSTDTFDEWLRKKNESDAKMLKADKEAFAEFQRKSGIDTAIRAEDVEDYDERFRAWKTAHDKQVAQEVADAKKIADEKLAAEKKAADDIHRQRVANAQAELNASKKSASALESVKASAKSEFDKAFGMYRDRDLAAKTIAEERDYAADYKQLQKDASRYGGKWRIDELSALMAAGDTQGQAAKLEEWRKSSRFTPEVESLVRAAAADQTRTTAEDELRKISANTAELAAKLDELLSLK